MMTCGEHRGQDHPRLCGEHHARPVRVRNLMGSPPPMRGTLNNNNAHTRPPGITPAYAGNTKLHNRQGKEQWDHPRLCGEHHGHSMYANSYNGSPPPMRGTRGSTTAVTLRQGITPAYAGNTNLIPANRVADWDHPRLCGEHPAGTVLGS